MSETGKVNIHGKEYTTVAARVQKFREEHQDKYGIETEIVSIDDERVVMKATIIKHDAEGVWIIATGYAEESRSSSQINRTSALENAETSAIGRALAAFGMAGTEYASADEVAQAVSQQSQNKPVNYANTDDRPVSEAQIGMLMGRFKEKTGISDRVELIDEFISKFGKAPNELKREEVNGILKQIGDMA